MIGKHYLFVVLYYTFLSNLLADKPNILWIYAEDTSPWMGCYGDKINIGNTPNIDSIAERGVLFKRAFVPAPVCSPCRSAIIIGQNQIRFGAHQHRSSRGSAKIDLPENYKLLPEIMRENGYETFNHGKTDYNFVWNQDIVYSLRTKESNPFKDLHDKQPFFGQIQTSGGKNNTNNFPKNRKVNPKDVIVPKDYPQNQIYRQTVAQHYDAIRKDDDRIGNILNSLQSSGLADNTIVVYFSDHGANNLLRHKQMTTEGGLHVPFIVMGPEKYIPQKQIRTDLVSLIDLTATTLSWAGIALPNWYEGRNLFAKNYQERTFVASAKDRLDHTIDRVRTIRTNRYRYVRNFKFDRIVLQPQYRDKKVYTKNIHALYKQDQLSRDLKRIYFGERPEEELYDVVIDPEMIHNLAQNSDYQAVLITHRKIMDNWLAKGDKGILKEPEEALKYNGEGKRWGEGVNAEYETYRMDSDGDGLSDKWEILNGRDPEDGLLLFDFNCGGWQTEGWETEDIDSKLAGFLGYLDFELPQGSGSIYRKGLKLSTHHLDKAMECTVRTNHDIEVKIVINDQKLGVSQITKSKDFQKISFPLLNNPAWKDSIQSLELCFEGSKKTILEIDAIKVLRYSF